MRRERLAVGVGDEIGGLGFFCDAILGERAGGEDFVAAIDQAGLRCRREVDAADVEFGQGLEFSCVGDAVAVGVLPDLDVGEGCVGQGELVVGVAVEGLDGDEAVGVGLSAGVAAGANGAVEVLGHRFADVVDLAVAVQIHDDDAVLSRYPAGLFFAAAVVVDVEEDGLLGIAGELDAVAVQVEHERIGGNVLGGVAVACGSGGEVEAGPTGRGAVDDILGNLIDGLEGVAAGVPALTGVGVLEGARAVVGDGGTDEGTEGVGVVVEGRRVHGDVIGAAGKSNAVGGRWGDGVGAGGLTGCEGGVVGDGDKVGGYSRS